jgi:hypothetical protein
MAEKSKDDVSVRGADAASGEGSGPDHTTDAAAGEGGSPDQTTDDDAGGGSLLDQIIVKGKMPRGGKG